MLLEDGESITIAMLRANKRKAALQQSRRGAPSEVKYVDEEQARARRRRRKAKSAVQNEENTKKRKRGNPSRSSFYTVVHSPDRVKRFLLFGGFRPEGNRTEKYAVDICTCDGVEFYVRLDNELSFIDIKFPNLRWFMTDIKRKWQPRPTHATREGLVPNDVMSRNRNVGHDGWQGRDIGASSINDVNQANDDILLDGWESDMRFLLQSRNTLPAQDIRETKYERYQCVLKASSPSCQRPFSVQEDLWKDVRLIRSIKSTKFPHCRAQGGRLSDFTVYLDEVTEYSRPGPSVNEFRTETTRWEVSLEAALPVELTEKETVKAFLNEVWEFSMSLSSFVSLL